MDYIDDLLNFSKLEAGKVVPDIGPLSVEEVIADTFEILSSLAARKGLELAYIVEADVPETVMGDSSRLRQILTNLLGNAIKFTHEGGVVIKCGLDEELEDDHVRLKFEVIDTGIGIEPEQQRNLFEPFSQVDGSTTRMYGGTGLGLSICLQLVRLMMGTVGVISEPNKGSNFWFSVVVQRVRVAEEETRPTPSMQLRESSILLATPRDATANMLGRLLGDLQLKRTTTDMQHAIAQALQERHDILLLDIPPMPSSYIAQQLQSVDDDPECDLHIILLYTPATEGHKVAAEATNSASDRRGRIMKMAKPARRLKLLRVLEQVLSHPRLTIQTSNSFQGSSNSSNPQPSASISSPPSAITSTSNAPSNQQSPPSPPSSQQQQQPASAPAPRPTRTSSTSSGTGNNNSGGGTKMTDHFYPHELEWFKDKPVLIAEDNMVAQKLLRKQLEKMGFVVESANNGEEAVQLWQQRPKDHFVIGFFDHHMPKCDGVEATRKIRQLESSNNVESSSSSTTTTATTDLASCSSSLSSTSSTACPPTPQRLPIVALTADVQTTARDVCVNAGMDGYLTKPLIPKDLAVTLRQLCPSLSSTASTPTSTSPS